ncbi:MAG: Bax inhibitor-1/YccA family protein [Vicingaceae bacterium]
MDNKVIIRKDGREFEASIAQTFISNVFTYMFAALTITGVMAWWFGTSEELTRLIVNPETGMTGLGYLVTFAPLGFVLIMSFAFERLNSMVLLLLYIAFSLLMGMSLSTIFLAYTAASIYSTFFITAITFGIMAVVGYTTKTDLTKFGSIMMMGLIGIIVASIFNWFIGSEGLDMIISIIGVLVFTGLTAYDVQKLKRIGAGVEYGTESTNKLAILGALNLYLDFINLFLFLLRFMGDRK